MKLDKNVGNTDRMIRVLAAIILAALYFTGAVSGTLGIVLLVLAAVLAATGAIGFCPIYAMLKLSTQAK